MNNLWLLNLWLRFGLVLHESEKWKEQAPSVAAVPASTSEGGQRTGGGWYWLSSVFFTYFIENTFVFVSICFMFIKLLLCLLPHSASLQFNLNCKPVPYILGCYKTCIGCVHILMCVTILWETTSGGTQRRQRSLMTESSPGDGVHWGILLTQWTSRRSHVGLGSARRRLQRSGSDAFPWCHCTGTACSHNVTSTGRLSRPLNSQHNEKT